MSGQRHEITFSMSPSSYSRVQLLLDRCGHTNLNLLLARGLALVEFVLDQAELGRVVGSVIMGEDEFLPLRERAELLKPGQEPRVAPSNDGQQQAPTAAQVPQPINPKLVARERVAPAVAPVERLPRARRLFKHAAFAVNDADGPVRSLAFHQERADSLGLLAPIAFNGNALPGELALDHLEEISEAIEQESMATHFLLCPATDDLSFYGYFPNTGWHRLSKETRQWALDAQVQAGEVSLFPMEIAAFYLRRQLAPLPHEQLLQA